MKNVLPMRLSVERRAALIQEEADLTTEIEKLIDERESVRRLLGHQALREIQE